MTRPVSVVLPPAPPKPGLIDALTVNATTDIPAQDLTIEEARALAEAVQKELRQTSLIEQMTQVKQATETTATEDRRFAESAETVRDIERPRGERTVDFVN
ncbi:hypothetical protein AADZ90_017765 [Aestuariibius sp. 2305UL40-4]|uniref:hypothetical protein n=1 Tax=Aestuariibius violaceus TaxID=3234132 RepID=UPI00345E3056